MNDRPQWTDFLQSPARVPGWPIKACAGLLCVGMLALALPLGVLGLCLLGYIWLILRVRVNADGDQPATGTSATGTSAADTSAEDTAEIVAPVDGRVVHIDTGPDNRCRVFLAPDVFDSHLHYAPVSGKTEDITWIDGSFAYASLDLPPDDKRVRREITFVTAAGHQVMLTQYGARGCRLIQCFLREGRSVLPSDRAGLALFGGVVAVSFSGTLAASLVSGQRCLAAQTILGHTS